ncbi:MAG: methionine--tRNA ligase [bacterium]|nr:methionine--tRNA ligase [bacterium]
MANSEKSNKFYITTAIDYINGKPHIGHVLEKVQADALARYHRLKGDEVLFLTGTDEHGAKNVRAAEQAGKTPSEFADESSANFRNLKNIFNLSWNDFIRTSDKVRHWPSAQKLWRELKETGDLYKKNYRGLYCVGHEAFVTEKDLVDGKCEIHQKEPEVIEEENWFFRLSKYTKEIESKIKSKELRIIPETRQNEILALLKEGLEDISFSRPAKDLSWGVPVPDDPEHTMYVWCDALTNYLSAIGYGQDDQLSMINYKHWWPADLHVIGKDILRFHAAIWPGMLLSAGLLLPKSIFVHGFITVEGQKMSKTIGNVIDPVDLVNKYGADSVRHYLLREIPSGEDGDFSYKKFEERHNGDLANGLGNLVARITALGEKLGPIDFNFANDIELATKNGIGRIFEDYEKNMQEIRLHEASGKIWELVSFADKYINDKKPWSLTDSIELKKVLINASYLAGAVANLLEPFLPETSGKIKRQINFVDSKVILKKGEHLFSRL